MRVLCIGLNAAVDKSYLVPGFAAEGAYRVRSPVAVPGGKALNVARMLRVLGVEGVRCTGFVGGRTGQWIREGLEALGIATDFVEVPGESRENLLIMDPATGSETRILEPGIPVDADALTELEGRVASGLRQCDVVVLAGSLPPETPADYYARLIRPAQSLDRPVFLDADGEALHLAVGACPALIKLNHAELSGLAGQPLPIEADLIAAGRGLVRRGIDTVIVTQGAGGAILVTGQEGWRAQPPAVTTVTTVGSGDAVLAGYVAGRGRGWSAADSLKLGVAAGTANACQLGAATLAAEKVEAVRPRVVLTPIPAGA